VAGKPMLLHSVQRFMARPDVHTVVVVLPRSHAADPPPWLFQCDVDRLLVSAGGRERAESVANGLEDVPEDVETVLIHDAARAAGARRRDRARDRGGAARATARCRRCRSSTRSRRSTRPGRSCARSHASGSGGCRRPRASRALIDRAHGEARRERLVATDDAALCERLGLPVVVVRGSERALKVTEEGDFARAEALSMLLD
jgi:2-C-methyl-D-erythritol 4-phosphate cytidylyltransferase